MDQRPHDVSEPTWNAFQRIFNAVPANRRTQNIPTTEEQALQAITNMARYLQVPPAAAGTMTDPGKLPFTPKDVPQYTGQYMAYRRELRDFVYTYETAVTGNLVRSAMFAIKTGLKEISDLASSKDAADFAPAGSTLLEAWKRYQDWLDAMLISATQHVEEQDSWRKMKQRARRAETAQEFYIIFQECLFKFNEACTRTGATRPTATEITRHFIEALPNDVAASARPLAAQVAGADGLDRDPYLTHKDLLDYQFALLRKRTTGPKALVTKRAREPDSEDEEEGQQAGKALRIQGRPFATPNKRGGCRRSWEDAPAKLQGPIAPQPWMTPEERRWTKERHERVRQAGVCARCRGPRERNHLHDDFVPVGPYAELPRAAEATATSEEEEQTFHDAEE